MLNMFRSLTSQKFIQFGGKPGKYYVVAWLSKTYRLCIKSTQLVLYNTIRLLLSLVHPSGTLSTWEFASDFEHLS